MGSIMDSQYWTCPHCYQVFDWRKDIREIESHNCKDEDDARDVD